MSDQEAEEAEDPLSLLSSLGLPCQFGSSSKQSLKQHYIDDIDDDILVEECDHECEGKRRKRKKRKQKSINEQVEEHTAQSIHTLFTEEFTTLELKGLFPNGLVYHLDKNNEPQVEGAKSTMMHVKFDEEGNPLLSKEDAPKELTNSEKITFAPHEGSILKKYHRQKYDLFSRFDEGIQIDEAGWYSVTPEDIALHTAQSIPPQTGCLIWDAFGGVGGNSIQFALAGHFVIMTELDERRIQLARNNAVVYGVDQWIEMICADSLQMSKFWRTSSNRDGTLIQETETEHRDDTFQCAFLSPPWGGPAYLEERVFDIGRMIPLNVDQMIQVAHQLSSNVIYYLPRNTDVCQLARLLPSSSEVAHCKIERHFLRGRFKVLIVHVT